MADDQICDNLVQISQDHLAQHLAPVEYEVDVHYPGAPVSTESEGAGTARRLLQAYSRHAAYRTWARNPAILHVLSGLFGAHDISMSQCHHNCVMTKQPGYSSVTLWHQDNRYWSFDQEYLIAVWLALGDEVRHNGCLRVIPGSHQQQLQQGRFDAAMFLRTDLAENKTLIGQSRSVELAKGDVLFFHSRLLHAAGRNRTDRTKLSLVFTYHEATNLAIEDTRSARFPSISLSE